MHLLTTFVTYSRLLAGPALITLLSLVLLFLRWVPQVLLFEVEQIAGFCNFNGIYYSADSRAIRRAKTSSQPDRETGTDEYSWRYGGPNAVLYPVHPRSVIFSFSLAFFPFYFWHFVNSTCLLRIF